LDPNHKTAKHLMSVAYFNEAATLADPERALALLQKSFEYEPDDPIGRNKLAEAFNAKGVRILKAMNQFNRAKEMDRAVGLFRRAALLLRPDLTEKDMDDYIKGGGGGFQKLSEGLYRTVLENITIALQERRRMGL